MGSARVEIYKKTGRLSARGSNHIDAGIPLKVGTETSSTTATTAGSRITCSGTGITQGAQYVANCVVDEDCYVSIGADPTAAAATSFLLKANVQRELPIRGGELISFKDVA